MKLHKSSNLANVASEAYFHHWVNPLHQMSPNIKTYSIERVMLGSCLRGQGFKSSSCWKKAHLLLLLSGFYSNLIESKNRVKPSDRTVICGVRQQCLMRLILSLYVVLIRTARMVWNCVSQAPINEIIFIIKGTRDLARINKRLISKRQLTNKSIKWIPFKALLLNRLNV